MLAYHYTQCLVFLWTVCPVLTAPLHVLDMTHTVDENTQYWSNQEKPQLLNLTSEKPGWRFLNMITGEHVGTHMDAPSHTIVHSKQYWLHEIPLENLFGPAVSIDVRQNIELHKNRNYAISTEDLMKHEAKHGAIPEGAFVFSCTGWADKYAGSIEEYWGTQDTRLGSNWSFPGFGGDAAKWLVKERNILGVGTDTPSCDVGNTTDSPVHREIMGKNLVCLEQVARTCELPGQGATVYAFPLKNKGGTGGPLRVVATWTHMDSSSSALPIKAQATIMVVAISSSLFFLVQNHIIR